MKNPNKLFSKAFKAAEEKDFIKAEKLYKKLINMKPEWDALASIYYNFGLVLMSLNKYKEAIKNFNFANKYKKSNENDWCKCLCLLNINEWEDAMKLFPSRFGETRNSNTKVNFPTLPLKQITDAKEAKGLKLLVLNEQGLGDEILFTSQLLKLDKIVDKAHVQVSKDNIDLLKEIYSFDNIELVTFESISKESLDMYNCWIGLGDVFSSLYVKNENISLDYEESNKEKNKVGVCWKANKKSPSFNKRSIDPIKYYNIKYDLESLQYGENKEEILGLDSYMPKNTLESWRKMDSMDVVITVDTLMTHLAGLKSIPTLLVTKDYIDWRWKFRDLEDKRYSMFYNNVEIINVNENLQSILEDII